MPWLLRGARRYYYRKELTPKGSRMVYYGCGPRAQFVARLDAFRAAMYRVECQALSRFLTLVAQCETVMQHHHNLITSEMQNAGYHRHYRGPWVKRQTKRRRNPSKPVPNSTAGTK